MKTAFAVKVQHRNQELLYINVVFVCVLVFVSSVVALDVNKIDVKYNKRISKYRDNDDKNG